ncbi:MAG TPA: SDR family NAD(P)-dependent oxidoreductase [Actinomycetota bacterium]|nr:SDR family NAD(P)-dependent oxidoreductase [Actinomycetota bacterium]
MIWITGASSGIGEALARSVPWADSRVIGIGRRPADGLEHVPADLSDSRSWPVVAEAVRSELEGFSGERAVFMHSAGTLDPIGFAADVDRDSYLASLMLNGVASQVLGQQFVAAASGVPGERTLVMISSGAAQKVYPGWSAYGASKAAMDQWVRIVGAEQRIRGGVKVFGVAPGVVDTPMQSEVRAADENQFPSLQRFKDLNQNGMLVPPEDVASWIWRLVGEGVDNGSIVDLRELMQAAGQLGAIS